MSSSLVIINVTFKITFSNLGFYQVTGISILALGLWTKVDLYKYMELSSIYYKDSPWILIGVGALIIIVGSFGCCCTAKGNVVLLYMVSHIKMSI